MDPCGKDLHDRLTRGAALSADEAAELEAWYAEKDAEELTSLSGSPPAEELTRVRQRVDEVIAALQLATQDIERQVAENERLRAENAALRQRLPLTAPSA